MSYCINPKCPKPADPLNAHNEICCNCGSQLVLQERYRVQHLLGEGGFAKTYEVDDRGTPKILKVLLINDPKAVSLLQQEARVLSQLRHPGIPRVERDGYFTFLPKDSHQPLHCLVMEKIEGINLEEWQRQHKNQPLSQDQALSWLKQLIEILDRVHQQLYFHRDIKPSNIILTSNEQLVLIDFGSAREVSNASLVKVNGEQEIRRMTSPGYTPLEQAKGKAVPQSDFFALGRTFVYLLTGKSPHNFPEDPRTGELLWQHQAPQVDKAVTDLIDGLMAPFPDNRPHNAQVILQRIAAIDHNWEPLQFQKQTPEFTNSLVGLQLQTLVHDQDSSTTKLKKLLAKVVKPKNLLLLSSVFACLGVAGALMYDDLNFLHNQSLITNNQLSPSPEPAAVPPRTISPQKMEDDAIAGISQTATVLPRTISQQNDANALQEQLEEPIASIFSGASYGINTVAVSPDGKTIASGSRDGMLKLWNLEQNTAGTIPTSGRSLGGDLYGENAVAFSPDGKLLVSGSDDNTIRIWDIEKGQLLHTLKGHSAWVSDLAFSSDGKTLISSSFDHTIKVWQLNNQQNGAQPVLKSTLQGHSAWVFGIALSSDGKTLASCSFDNTIKIWNLDNGEIRHTFNSNSERVFALAMSSDGTTLASGNEDGTIQLWNLSTGQRTKTLNEHQDWVRALAISPNGNILVSGSGSQDTTIKIWNLNTGKLLRTLKGHSDDVRSLAFSPDGKTLVSGSFDNTIKIWQLP
ncbi:MAG: serine/threonine-protein kinase [Cyanobacteriota bacterium]